MDKKKLITQLNKKYDGIPLWNWILLVSLGVTVLIGGIIVDALQPEPPPPAPVVEVPKTAAEIRQEKIESGFSKWDGSHKELTKVIKASMNDPKSYEHVLTKYTDEGDYLLIYTEFRGTNKFGAVVKESVAAKADLDGNIIEIIAQD